MVARSLILLGLGHFGFDVLDLWGKGMLAKGLDLSRANMHLINRSRHLELLQQGTQLHFSNVLRKF